MSVRLFAYDVCMSRCFCWYVNTCVFKSRSMCMSACLCRCIRICLCICRCVCDCMCMRMCMSCICICICVCVCVDIHTKSLCSVRIELCVGVCIRFCYQHSVYHLDSVSPLSSFAVRPSASRAWNSLLWSTPCNGSCREVSKSTQNTRSRKT